MKAPLGTWRHGSALPIRHSDLARIARAEHLYRVLLGGAQFARLVRPTVGFFDHEGGIYCFLRGETEVGPFETAEEALTAMLAVLDKAIERHLREARRRLAELEHAFATRPP